ncbi:MAG: hypothetical protein GYA23_02430 [Methanomicrobiales archaeon]|nr:hypothetical protein [Methanomicrobiales archaeon]
MADEIPEDLEEFTSPHLPERYHQTVRAKRQRRLKKQAVIVIVALVVMALMFLVLNWAAGGLFSSIPSFTGAPHTPGATTLHAGVTTPVTPNTTNASAFVTRGPGLAGQLPAGAVSLETALSQARSDYPEPEFAITRADFSTENSRPVFVFTIHSTVDETIPDAMVFFDAMTGLPYSLGEEKAKIARTTARQVALVAFPALHPDRTLLAFSTDSYNGNVWDFTHYKGGRIVAAGSFDADTGEQRSFFRYPDPEGRPPSPVLDAARAQAAAERYIIDHNGGQLPLNMSRVRYTPATAAEGTVAGQYTFTFERTYQDFLADVDGFEVTVDAVTGDINGYTSRWTTPDHAFSAAYQPDVIRREATFIVMQKAQEVFPGDASGLRIISAELRWKNRVPYGTVPRPGTIPLAWKVVFDDDFIRGNTTTQPAVAWLDIHSGDFIALDYQH